MPVVQFFSLSLVDDAFGVPGVGEYPRRVIFNGHDGEAEIGLARHRRRAGAVRREHVLCNAPIFFAVSLAHAAYHEADLVLFNGELRHWVVANPTQATFISRRVRVLVRCDAGCWHVQEREVRGIQVALNNLCPVAVQQLFSDVSVLWGNLSKLELWDVRQHTAGQAFGGRPQICPDVTAIFSRWVGLNLHCFVHADPGRYVRQFHGFAVYPKFPPVIDAAQPAVLIAAIEQVGSAMWASGIDQANLTPRVAETDQSFAQNIDADWWSVRLRKFL